MFRVSTLFLAGDWKSAKLEKSDWLNLRVVYLRDSRCTDLSLSGFRCIEMDKIRPNFVTKTHFTVDQHTESSITKNTEPDKTELSDISTDAPGIVGHGEVDTSSGSVSSATATVKPKGELSQVQSSTVSPLKKIMSSLVTARARPVLVDVLKDITSVMMNNETENYENITTSSDGVVNLPKMVEDNNVFTTLMLWESQMPFIIIGVGIIIGAIAAALLIWTLYSCCRRRQQRHLRGLHKLSQRLSRQLRRSPEEAMRSVAAHRRPNPFRSALATQPSALRPG
jgi:hypothetical protein